MIFIDMNPRHLPGLLAAGWVQYRRYDAMLEGWAYHTNGMEMGKATHVRWAFFLGKWCLWMNA